MGRNSRGGRLRLYRGSAGTFRIFLNKVVTLWIWVHYQWCSQNLFYFIYLCKVFCSDILFFISCHQLCVKQDYSLLFILPILYFLGRFKWPTSPLLSLLNLFFRLSIYPCQHSMLQHHLFSSSSCPLSLHFLSITVLSSESPSRASPIHFLFVFLLCAYLKVIYSLILSITSLFALCSV